MTPSHIARWIATPAGIAFACVAGGWLYLETAFDIGLGAGIRCLSSRQADGSCMTASENIRFWSWAIASGALSGLGSVILGVMAAPRHRSRARWVATLVPPLAWAWICDWDLSDPTAAVLVGSALAGGLIAWMLLPRLLARIAETPQGSER